MEIIKALELGITFSDNALFVGRESEGGVFACCHQMESEWDSVFPTQTGLMYTHRSYYEYLRLEGFCAYAFKGKVSLTLSLKKEGDKCKGRFSLKKKGELNEHEQFFYKEIESFLKKGK